MFDNSETATLQCLYLHCPQVESFPVKVSSYPAVQAAADEEEWE